MLPSRIFFDNFLDDFETPKKFDKMMKCDIYEDGDNYIIEVDVPGVKKEDISMDISNGYLKVAVEMKEENKENKKYIHRERHSYTKCERSFYVGNIDEESIKAKFNNGILKISVPMKEIEHKNKKTIMIED